LVAAVAVAVAAVATAGAAAAAAVVVAVFVVETVNLVPSASNMTKSELEVHRLMNIDISTRQAKV
jgi:hypothetical protein